MPYALFLGSIIGLAYFIQALVLGKIETEPAVTKIETIEDGTNEKEWVVLEDGAVSVMNVVKYWQERNNKPNLNTYYIPYCSQDRTTSWIINPDQKFGGSVVLLKYNEDDFLNAFPKWNDANDGVLNALDIRQNLSVTGVLSSNRFSVPKEVKKEFDGKGFEHIYILEPGSKPMSKGLHVVLVGVMTLCSIVSMVWVMKRMSAGTQTGDRYSSAPSDVFSPEG